MNAQTKAKMIKQLRALFLGDADLQAEYKNSDAFIKMVLKLGDKSPFKRNLCTSSDSYKASHPKQFPRGTTHTSYYVEARGGKFDEIMVQGLHGVARILEQGVTVEDVERANNLFKSHFGRDIFVYKQWLRIATEFDGKIPVNMFGVKECAVLPVKNAMAVLENTHEDYYWLPGHFEPLLMRGIWYPTAVGTISFHVKEALRRALERTSDLTGADLDFILKTRLHDFGLRGVSSEESARIGGLAHLMNFIGTDTVEALIMAQDLYNMAEDFAAGISIPAREHSTTISYGDDGELTPDQEDEAFENSIDQYGDGVYACVMDSKDFEAAVLRVSRKFKAKILDMGGVFVFRPDSGDMFANIKYALETLSEEFGYTVNSKGFKVLHPSVRIIQGDGLNKVHDIVAVTDCVEDLGYSVENIAFGMGGGLLQQVNRDTHKVAMKMSALKVNGVWRKVRKTPKGAEWKTSKAGRLRLVKIDGEYRTVDILEFPEYEHVNEYVQYLRSGYGMFEYNEELFLQIRAYSDTQHLTA